VTAFRAKAKYRKVIIKRGGALDAKATHNGEARTIDQGKILITIGNSYLPGCLQVRRADGLDGSRTASQPFPKPLGGMAMNSVSQKRPSFEQDVVRRHQRLAIGEDYFCTSVANI
jgi:hypothetical protein